MVYAALVNSFTFTIGKFKVIAVALVNLCIGYHSPSPSGGVIWNCRFTYDKSTFCGYAVHDVEEPVIALLPTVAPVIVPVV